MKNLNIIAEVEVEYKDSFEITECDYSLYKKDNSEQEKDKNEFSNISLDYSNMSFNYSNYIKNRNIIECNIEKRVAIIKWHINKDEYK
jgi:hypothetical protein